MRSTQDIQERIKATFNSNDTLVAQDLIDAGINPYYAWLHVRGTNESSLANVIRADDILHVSNTSLGSIFSNATGYFEAITDGSITPSGQIVAEFCEALGITPDQLLPSYMKETNEKLLIPPAPPEIVEAAVLYIHKSHTTPDVRARILKFLGNECFKMQNLSRGNFLPEPEVGSNAAILYGAQDNYEIMFKEQPGTAKDIIAIERNSSIEDIRALLEDILNAEDAFVLRRLAGLEFQIQSCKKKSKAQEKMIQDCATVLAPMDRSAKWQTAFTKGVDKFGFEAAVKRLLREPECFSTLRPHWHHTATLMHPELGYIRGPEVIEAFIDAYRKFQKHTEAIRNNEEEYEQTLKDCMDFRTWRAHPITAYYLQAEANARHILGHLDHAELNNIAFDGASQPAALSEASASVPPAMRLR